MIIINFSHPFTPAQLDAIRQMSAEPIERVLAAPVQFDHQQPFLPQLKALMDKVGLSPEEWQTASLLINPPSLSSITAMLLAEIHGRAGYFPPIIRLRPVMDSVPPRYEAAEVLNLQAVRESARMKRSHND